MGGDLFGSRQARVQGETVPQWIIRSETDAGRRPGAATDDSAALNWLKHENAELRRARDLLKEAVFFFGAELDRRSTR